MVAVAELRRCGLLRPLIRQRLIIQAIQDIQLDPEELEKAISLFQRKHSLGDAGDLERWRLEQGLEPEDLAWLIERPLRIQQFSVREFGSKAEQQFLRRKTALDRLVISLIQVPDRGLAQELYLRVVEGEADLGELASRYSVGKERHSRGLVDPVNLERLPPRLRNLLLGATEGSLLPPVQAGKLWVVARLESRIEARFEGQLSRKMSLELFDEWLDAECRRLLRPQAESLPFPAPPGRGDA